MTGAATLHLQETERLDRRLAALFGSGQQQFRRHDRAVKPVHLTAAPNAADHANVAAGNLGGDVGDEKFGQAVRIGRRRRQLLHSHSIVPQPHQAKGENCIYVENRTLNFHTSAKIRLRIASCSDSGKRAETGCVYFSKNSTQHRLDERSRGFRQRNPERAT